MESWLRDLPAIFAFFVARQGDRSVYIGSTLAFSQARTFIRARSKMRP